MTPTPGALQDGDSYGAAVPEELFPLPPSVDPADDPTFAVRLVEWLPVLAGVAIGVVIGVAATFIVLRARRSQ
ncbi:hypothetical protein GCM10020001_116340 [Nonomuraea salmonea]